MKKRTGALTGVAPRLVLGLVVAFAMLATTVTVIVTVPAHADTFDSHDAVVSEDPYDLTPEVLDGTVQAVAVAGSTVVIGGDFTQVRDSTGTTYTLPYIFAFDQATGVVDLNFDPVLNKEVFTLAASADDQSVFVGGAFTVVNGSTNKKGLTKLDLADGERTAGFVGRTDARVKDLKLDGDVLYIAGTFEQVISTPVELLTAIDAATGRPLTVDGLAPQGKVEFFADPNYAGTSWRLGVGTYPFTVVNTSPVGNDAISSFEIPDGYTVEVCEHDVGVGICETYTTSQPSLTTLDNQISSIVITASPLVFDIDFAAPYSTTNTVGTLSVDKIDLTPDGSRLVAVGNFGMVDALDRGRLAMFETASSPASVSGWNTDLYDVQCNALIWPQYIRDIDISPDGTYLVAVTTGGYSSGDPACDTVARFEVAGSDPAVEPTWLNYSGGDTFYGVAISGEAIYVGGHFRWLNNPYVGNAQGVGGVPRNGLAALDPLNGLPLSWRSDRSPRGVGTYDLVVEPDGLWVGDDTDFLNGEFHPRLKFLPLAGGAEVPRPELPVLPTTVFSADSDSFDAATFDGTTFGAPMELLTGPYDEMRGSIFLSGALFYGDINGDFWVRSFDGTALSERAAVNLYGLTTDEFEVASITGMWFSHDEGRIYYSRFNRPNLFWRHFTPESEIVGAEQFKILSSGVLNWGTVRGMDRIGDHLYYGLEDGTLHRIDMVGSEPVAGTDVVLSGPTIDGRDWSERAMSFFAAGELFGPPPTNAEYEFESSGSSTSGSWQTFDFPVAAGDEVTVKLEWDDPTAELNVFLRDETNTNVVGNKLPAGSPKWLQTTATTGGMWSVAVKIKSGATDYNVLVNPVEEPPAGNAEFEFSSSGSDSSGSWQVFDFPVDAGDPLVVRLEWADPAALLNVFVRDETNTTIVKDTTTNGSPKEVSTTAATGGMWSVAVKIKSGTTAFDVLVNPS